MNAPAAHNHHADRSNPYVARVDPRLRLVAAVSLAVAISVATQLAALIFALAGGLIATVAAGIPASAALRRTVPLNVLIVLLACVLPLTTPGEPLFELAELAFTREGVLLTLQIAIKGNAIVLWLMALVGTLEPVTLGHALDHLYVPTKLAHLLLFTVRYVEVLHGEYLRLRAAMKVRGFRARCNRHTYRSLGHLAGMLLIRGFERSDRVLAAMKCRGFSGRFFLLDHFALCWDDAPFAVATAACLATILALNWGLR